MGEGIRGDEIVKKVGTPGACRPRRDTVWLILVNYDSGTIRKMDCRRTQVGAVSLVE